MASTPPPPPSNPREDDFYKKAFTYVMFIALPGGACLVLIIAYLAIGSPIATPTPAVNTPVATLGLLPDLQVEAEVAGSVPQTLTLTSPTFLTLKGQQLPVSIGFVREGQPLTAPAPEAQNAVWVYGTVVNYVFGLPSEANKQLLEGLTVGERVQITTKGAQKLEFAITGRELTTEPDAVLFDQTRPGILLVWLGELEGGQRLIVRGEYVIDTSAGSNPATNSGTTVELGQTAQVGELRLTATGATRALDRPEAPPGFSLYFVDFTLENLSTAPLDTGLLRFVLVDDLGNQYSLNNQVSQLGNNALLTGLVNAGAQVQATAGYQIPLTLTSENLKWRVSRADKPGQIEVVIPFGSGATAQNAQITLQQASVSPDGTSLTLVGQILNNGADVLVITENDVSLMGGNTLYLIFSTSPGFPWQVSPGQNGSFVVTFQRPTTETAVFQVLNQSFELTGLR